jgi:hypothetical protein
VRAKIRVTCMPEGALEVVNTSHEKVSVKGLDWPDFVTVRPNTEFTGDFFKNVKQPVSYLKPERPPVQYPDGVRRATVDDIDELCLMVPQLLAETTVLPVSTEKVATLIKRCVLREGGSIVGVIDGPDGIDASVGLDVADSDVSDERYVRGLWLGLHPGLRAKPAPHGDPRANHGRRLFEFARWYHDMLEKAAGNSILMQFALATTVNMESKMGFYHRNATPIGATFAYLTGGEFLRREVETAA